MEDLSKIVAQHPFAKGLSDDYVKFLTGCAANVKFQKGEYLFREAGPAERVYLIREGEASVQVYSPATGSTTIATLGAGDVAGWSWAVAPFVSHFDVKAESLVRAISLDAGCLRNKSQTDPAFGYEMLARMMTVLERRLQATQLQLLDIYGPVR
jgi:CRP/FNR family transcriptional regulator, cyclic AMP receptor protein